MFDQPVIEQFLRSKIFLQEKLSEIGDMPGSSEIESQMEFVENRTYARVKQSIHHGIHEMDGLRHTLIAIGKASKED